MIKCTLKKQCVPKSVVGDGGAGIKVWVRLWVWIGGDNREVLYKQHCDGCLITTIPVRIFFSFLFGNCKLLCEIIWSVLRVCQAVAAEVNPCCSVLYLTAAAAAKELLTNVVSN